MSLVMMALGSFKFGVSTAAYQDLSRSADYRWPAQDRFGQHAALQFTGPGSETITLSGVIYPGYRGGAGQVDAMRALAGRGVPQVLIDGTGRILGEWVIESVQERGTVFAAAGVPRRQDFTLTLRRYVSGGAGGLAGALGAALGAAVGSSGPFPSVSAATSAIGALGGSVASAIGAASGGLSSAIGAVNGAIAGAANVIARVNGAVAAAQTLVGAAGVLRQVGSQVSAQSGLQGLLSASATLAGAAATASSAAGALAGSGGGFGEVQLAASRLAGEATRASSQAGALIQRIDPWPGT